jgi:hypothetical protein
LLLNPKINYMNIPTVVPVKNVRTIPPCGNSSNLISQTFLNHSSHWFKLNDVMRSKLVVFSTNKTDRHDITEILLDVALNTITPQ